MSVPKAALYIRVSTDEQARHGYSLGEQRADLEAFATAKGYAIVGVYADEGVSARKAMSRRKELQRLLTDVQNGRVNVIVIKCLDRWFRNVADFYEVQKILDKHNVAWQCTREDIDTTTTNGRLMLNLRLSIAQNESDQTSDRIKYVFDGKRQRKEAVSGALPIGIAIKDKRYIPDERAAIVQHLFNYISSGHSKYSAIGEIHSRFGIALTMRQIGTMLTNRFYLGEYHGIPGYCQPIISRELFGAVQEILARNPKHMPTGRVYLFSGLIRCPSCGNRLAGFRGNASRVDGEFHNFCYYCVKHMKNGGKYSTCTYGGHIFERALESFLLDNIQRLATEHIHAIEFERRQGGESTKAKLAAVKNKLSRLKDLYLNNVIDMEAYKADYAELKAQEQSLSTALARQPSIPPVLYKVIDTPDIRAEYNALTTEHKKELWQSIIERIEFDATPEMSKAFAKKTFRVFFRRN